MKRFFIAAAAVLALFSCQKPEDVIVAPEKADKITVTPKSGDITAEGGIVKVLVSSSADWTLAGKTDYSSWAVPSKLSGEDGDIVEFKVNPNETGNKLVAEWTFTCGKATETYILTSLPKVVMPDHLKLVSPATDVVDYNEGRYELVVESSIHYRQLTATLSEGASEWLTYRATLEGENKGEAKFVFDYKALSSLDDRTATITVSAEGVDPVTVTFTQEAKHRLDAVKSFISAKPAGETVAIPLIVNVAYKVEISADGKSWIEHKGLVDGVDNFVVSAFSGEKRSATITFTQTDALAGETPLSATVQLTQQETLIKWAANMYENRLFPKWESTTVEKLGKASALTMECLIKPSELTQDISTVMGIEGMFLLRFGDSAKKNELQVATHAGNYTVPFSFETGKWYHIACTYEIDRAWNANVRVYVNGELKGEKLNWKLSTYVGWPLWDYVYGVDFSPAWSYEQSSTRCFWMGYSYDANRSFNGLMTEIRLWKKVLSAEEINADGHFYSVDPKAEALYSYWKFTKGEGTSIEDATGNGNALYGELNVRKQGSDNKGDAGIKFEAVSLPEN